MKIYVDKHYVKRLDFCCNEMADLFLTAKIDATTSSNTGHTILQYRGLDLDYCPFCGAEIENVKE